MIRSFYLTRIVYYAGALAAVLFVLSYFFPGLIILAQALLALLALAVALDTLLLYATGNRVEASRIMADRFSNGDDNRITLRLQNKYPFAVWVHVIDEVPVQFQEREWLRETTVAPNSETSIEYYLRPVSRGAYRFGDLILLVHSPLRLVSRRYRFPLETVVRVYPSYVQMRHYQLLTVDSRFLEAGLKRVRRLGHSMEFEQIKEYVRGDDYRTINWKATARKADLMVNTFTDERSQQVYCLISKGRVMRMPFGGMTLLDYAINTSLVLCNVALGKQDKAGLITYAESLDTFVPADRKATQMNVILESLYKQDTKFLEPNLEKLFSVIRTKINHRSLLVMFTNFESLESLRRDLPSLKRIARYHLLLVVFFENTELNTLVSGPASTTEDIYIKTIAEKFMYEKQLMVKELYKHGILSILSTPANLTINAINKYLELKNRLSI